MKAKFLLNFDIIRIELLNVGRTQIFNEKYHLIFVKNLGVMEKKCEGGSEAVEDFGSDK